jgi:hypothetical protein
LALGGVTRPARERRERTVQTRGERLRREQRSARGGEFDRQRQAVEPCANLGDGARVGVIGAYRGVMPSCSGQKQRARRAGLDASRRDFRILAREPERRERVGLLAGEIQRLAACCQYRQPRAASEEARDERCRFEHVLEVVDDQQEFFGFECSQQRLLDRLARERGERERLTDGGWHVLRASDRRQFDPGSSVLEPRHCDTRKFQREPRLADPARSDQRHEARTAGADQGDHLVGFTLPSEQRDRSRACR